MTMEHDSGENLLEIYIPAHTRKEQRDCLIAYEETNLLALMNPHKPMQTGLTFFRGGEVTRLSLWMRPKDGFFSIPRGSTDPS